MKVLNRVFQILTSVFGLAALICFFMDFAKFTVGSETYSIVGSVLAFGGKEPNIIDGITADFAASFHLMFCLLVTAFGFVFSLFSFKKKGLRYTVPVFALTASIYMLVLRLMATIGDVVKIDPRATLFKGDKEIGNWTRYEGFLGSNTVLKVELTDYFLFAVIALFAFAACSIAYLLIDDAIEVAASKGAKKTIFKRIGLFFRDYKSEVKKIVWPSIRDVLKNTGIVLIMCAIVGVLIWALDAGLLKLLEIILNAATA